MVRDWKLLVLGKTLVLLTSAHGGCVWSVVTPTCSQGRAFCHPSFSSKQRAAVNTKQSVNCVASELSTLCQGRGYSHSFALVYTCFNIHVQVYTFNKMTSASPWISTDRRFSPQHFVSELLEVLGQHRYTSQPPSHSQFFSSTQLSWKTTMCSRKCLVIHSCTLCTHSLMYILQHCLLFCPS